MQRFLYTVMEVIEVALHWLTIVILLWGVTLAGRDFLISRFTRSRPHKSCLEEMTRIKNNLGGYVLLGLEVLIVADIIDSVAQPSFEDIARLAAMVGIRTVISFFLNKELQSEHDHYD